MQSSSQNVTNYPTPSIFYRSDALPIAQPTVSKHWREDSLGLNGKEKSREQLANPGSTGIMAVKTVYTCVRAQYTEELRPSNQSMNQSIKMHLYSAICRKRIRGACCAGLDRMFTFAVYSIKQFSFQSTPETTERLSWPTAVRHWVPDRWGINIKGFRR